MTNTLDELKRLIDLLPETDPRSSEYQMLLRSIEVLGNDGIREGIDNILRECCPEQECGDCEPNLTVLHPQEEEAETSDAPESDDIPSVDGETLIELFGTTEPTKEMIRGYLAEAKLKNSVEIKPFFQLIGVSRLSETKPSLYPAIVYYVEHEKGED